MESVDGPVSLKGVSPIGFELQAMEERGVAPDPHGRLPPINDMSPTRNGNIQDNVFYPAETGQEPSRRNTGIEDPENKTLFFNDGKRAIDFVLVYQQETDTDEKKRKRRFVFEENLKKSGVELEREVIEYEQDEHAVFIKLHAPWAVLTAQAELMNMKMPLAKNDMAASYESCWKKCPTPFHYNEDLFPPLPDYFTAPFSRERIDQFIIESQETFFSPAQRSLLLYQILERCVYDENEEDKTKSRFGIKKLISSDVYDAAFPLHEGNYKSEHSILTLEKTNIRHLLYETWAKPGAWFKFQPLDHIRLYFGEKIGIYFAWLGYYTEQLLSAAIIGLIAFFYGVGTVFSDPASKEICDKNGAGNFTMCPLCDEQCTYWFLERSCIYSRATYLFDNEATVAFAAFMALWASFFHEMWKRRTAEIEYDWDVADYEEEETIRPEFEASVTRRKKNPVSQIEEPYLSMASRGCRYLSSLWVVVFMLCVVIAAVFGVIVYRITVSAALFGVPQDVLRERASTITTVTSAVINLIIIIILGKVYQIIAEILTNFETHRTQTEWEDSFTLKMFLFQFVNYFSSLFYIAFFKGKLVGRPGAYNRDLSRRQEECDPAGCLIELCIQLAIIMVGKQAFNNIKEIVFPKLINWFKSRRVKEEEEKTHKHAAQWEKDYNMSAMPDLGLFDEYLEMVIQFGFVTIFVAAFPLAPLFALLNNILEIRLDAYKFVTQWRRPLATRAQDIGIWFGILRGITTVAIATNACIIAFTSEFIPKLVYRYAYNNGSLDNYISSFSLSVFATKDFEAESVPEKPMISKFGNVTHCRYRDFREPPGSVNEYKFTMEYWHVLTGRLAFVIFFILVVVFLTWLVSFLVPDVPRKVKLQILREKHLAKEAILQAEMSRKRERSTASSSGTIRKRNSPKHDVRGSSSATEPPV